MATQPSPQQATIDRNRALAMALQAQGMAPLQSPGVRGARISPWEGISKIGQALMGSYQNQQLDQQQAALSAEETGAQQARTKALVAALMDPKTDPAKASAIVEALNAGDPAANIGLESILPQAPPPDYTLGQNQNRISGTTGATIAQGPVSQPTPRQDVTMTPFEAWQKQNPEAPVSDWLALTAPAAKPEPAAPSDKEIDTFTNKDGFRVTTFLKPDGTTYERKSTEKVQATGNPYLDAQRQLNLENQTQAAPGQVIYAATHKPVAAKDLTDSATTKISDLQNLIGQADKVKGILDKLGATGAIKGYVMREGVHIPIIQGQLTPDQAEAVSEVYRLVNSYIYAVSGKAITESEFGRLSKTAPSLTYTPKANEVILKNFRDYAQKGLDNFMRVNGWALKEAAAPEAGGVPAVGGTYNGSKVLKVEKVKE